MDWGNVKEESGKNEKYIGRKTKNFFLQAEDGIRDFCLSRGLGDVYKRQQYSYS